MSAEILDGRELAKKTRAAVKKRAKQFALTRGRAPRLDVVLVGEDPASKVYVSSKERAAARAAIEGRVHRFPATVSQREIEAAVAALSRDEDVDGILVQLPLPRGLDAGAVIAQIDPEKDVDGLSDRNAGRLLLGERGLRPCTPVGCLRLIQSSGRSIEGLQAIVVGRSVLVGKPVALMLLEANATVTIAHSRTRDLPKKIEESDILIAAIGQPEKIQGAWIKPGAIVIDVGINRTIEGNLVGDVEYSAAAERAGFITPVPGGVGPMTIASLLENTVTAAEWRSQ